MLERFLFELRTLFWGWSRRRGDPNTSACSIVRCFPYLSQLLGAYLHQDFDINGPELSDSVAAYATDGGWLDVMAARADISRFIDYHRDDLDAALEMLDSGHSREPGSTAAEFLRWLDETLATLQAAGSESSGSAPVPG